MFEIQMLPADEGDCLILTYGQEGQPPCRVLIDGGTHATFPRLKHYLREELKLDKPHFELLIVTHIDRDHIGGILPLLRSDLGVTFGDIWFNGWEHLAPRPTDLLGPRQGDLLGNLLSARHTLPWNRAFGGRSVVVPRAGSLPTHVLPGGLKLTLLSPRWKELAALDRSWTEEAFSEGRIPGEDPDQPGQRGDLLGDLLGRAARLARFAGERFYPDDSAANGSSIAVLAEFEGKRALLTGDAFADVLADGIRHLPGFSGSFKVDAFKLPHHGSRANLNPDLVKLVSCSRYLISTSGNRHKHPDADAILTILENGPEQAELCFNYRSEFTQGWEGRKPLDKETVKDPRTLYPEDAGKGLRVSL